MNEETVESIIVPNRIFDMSEDGIYGLIVSQKFTEENRKEQTITNDSLSIHLGAILTQAKIDEQVKEREKINKVIIKII